MKFSAFKEFRGVSDIMSLTSYVAIELATVLRELRTGLTRLTFQDNFESYELSLTLAAGEEQAISNPFRSGAVPTKWIKVKTNQAGLSVCDGVAAWTETTLYLKNTHATDQAVLTVIFLR